MKYAWISWINRLLTLTNYCETIHQISWATTCRAIVSTLSPCRRDDLDDILTFFLRRVHAELSRRTHRKAGSFLRESLLKKSKFRCLTCFAKQNCTHFDGLLLVKASFGSILSIRWASGWGVVLPRLSLQRLCPTMACFLHRRRRNINLFPKWHQFKTLLHWLNFDCRWRRWWWWWRRRRTWWWRRRQNRKMKYDEIV